MNYNLPHFDPLWAAITDANLPITFHVSTGRDPRAARGNGGAVVNYVSHSLSPTIEPVANLCASGVLERFPTLRFATIEAGIGWVPWLLEAMDEAYKKHHFWVRPKLKHLPSDYYRMHGFSSFQEDKAGLDLAESHDLADNFMWANDYPHHEGTWPHSAEAIERTMGQLSDGARAKVLGLNCARFLGLDVPAKLPPMSERTLRGKVAVAGVGETPYYRHGKAPEPEFKLALQAILAACEDAGIDPRRIDGFASYSQRPQRSVAAGRRARPAGAALLQHALGRRRRRRLGRGRQRGGRGRHRHGRLRRGVPRPGAGPVPALRRGAAGRHRLRRECASTRPTA